MATYLFIYYCIFLIALFIVPSYVTYKRTGINPFKFSKEETAINYVGKAKYALKQIKLVSCIVGSVV